MLTLLHSIHVDLDGAWPAESVKTSTWIDCRDWGRRLRYTATAAGIEEFYQSIRPQPARFTLLGSGDFHHLTALWLRKIEEPFTLLSFDNHPDWDTRPPRWGCGTWINRALELPALRQAAIWGCGNFELNWPGYLFVDREALRDGRLSVWPWKDRLKPSGRKRWGGMARDDWRGKFGEFVRSHGGGSFYVTVDLDSLAAGESVTNWESGLFTKEDIVWALGELRAHARIIGGDVCGAYSKPCYERWTQWVAATFDHPRLKGVDESEAQARNLRALQPIWDALAVR
jgi:arginase family enzyme